VVSNLLGYVKTKGDDPLIDVPDKEAVLHVVPRLQKFLKRTHRSVPSWFSLF